MRWRRSGSTLSSQSSSSTSPTASKPTVPAGISSIRLSMLSSSHLRVRDVSSVALGLHRARERVVGRLDGLDLTWQGKERGLPGLRGAPLPGGRRGGGDRAAQCGRLGWEVAFRVGYELLAGGLDLVHL